MTGPIESRSIFEQWMVLESVSMRQMTKATRMGASPKMVCNDIRKRYGCQVRDDIAKSVMFGLCEQGILFRRHEGGGRYAPLTHYFGIRPGVRIDGIADPYDGLRKEEADSIAEVIRRADEDIAKSELRKERNRKESAERRKVRRKRSAARRGHRTNPGIVCLDTAREVIDYVKSIADPLVIVLDTETTGLDPVEDDVVELSILDARSGNVLYESYYDSWADGWPEAERVNGINKCMVAGMPKIEDRRDEVSEIISKADVIIGYNISFDICFLLESGIIIKDGTRIYDVMEEFAEIFGQWEDWINDGDGGYKWQKLTTAAAYYHISTKGAHDSTADCRMTLAVMCKILATDEGRADAEQGCRKTMS